MEAVGEFYQDNPYILGHGEEHLTKVLCLHLESVHLVILTYKLQFIQLGHAIHQISHISSEGACELLHGHFGIFYHVMQKAGYDSLLIKFQFRKDDRNTERMDDIGFA